MPATGRWMQPCGVGGLLSPTVSEDDREHRDEGHGEGAEGGLQLARAELVERRCLPLVVAFEWHAAAA